VGLKDTPVQSQLEERSGHLGDVEVVISTYPVGTKFACRISNLDGAVIGRGMGTSRDEAETLALKSAALKLDIEDAKQILRASVQALPSSRKVG